MTIRPSNRFRAFLAAIAACAPLCLLAGQTQAQWLLNGSNVYYNAGNVGIRTATPGAGLAAISSATPNAVGVMGVGSGSSSASVGVRGISYAANGYGGLFDGGQFGLFSRVASVSGSTVGVWGEVASPTGWGGVFKGGQWGVWGEARAAGGYGGYFLGRGYFSGNVGIGISNPLYPLHAIGPTFGVVGVQTTTSGQVGNPVAGVKGLASGPNYVTGVWGVADRTSGINVGVAGNGHSPDGYGVIGTNLSTSGSAYGVYGATQSPSGYGVVGSANTSTGFNFGVLGKTNSLSDGWGVYSQGTSGCSGFKAFNIDHPLDPANKYLNHFSAEGPEALLVYRGNVVLNDAGEAWVELPAYFESINRDVSYQLTAVGAAAPMLHIAAEVKDHRFAIAGGPGGIKVSWTVTGVRNDAFARAYPKPVEEEKPSEQRGTYLHPELYGQGPHAGLLSRGADVRAFADYGQRPVEAENFLMPLPEPVTPPLITK